MDRRQFIAGTAGGIALAPAAGWSQETYPNRPVKLVVPFPPGGPTDIMGRTAAKAMGDALGQSFVVENKAGAGGNIGTDAVAKAAPDGYTLGLSAISSLAISPHLYDKLPFQVEKDLAPISLVGTTPCVIVVHPSAPFSDLKGLVAYAKANPGQLGYATSGIGTSNHLAAELLQSVAGIQLLNVPYKGSSQVVPDLLSGTVLMSMESSLATTLQHIRSGKLKALAVTSPARAQALPNVPTVAESGYPGFAVETWFGLIAPAATPPAIVQQLRDAWAKGAKSSDAVAAFDNISANLRVTTPQEFGAFIQAENTRWGGLIRQLGIKAG
ncbi:Bug family tripartite tricarboxylate transporter substrate binding protein [Hydrogenophaga palleronii]|uniref:Bug family tripartite tricarboxylate transporter substrate binding protein n=1 Tax=Hydrogenophaga palleronii TaxID=65655 RepID=UPI000825C809|nr:tripartite tricarboxylate transporter substrate binding protein [Hydrogenophaga palleronii]